VKHPHSRLRLAVASGPVDRDQVIDSTREGGAATRGLADLASSLLQVTDDHDPKLLLTGEFPQGPDDVLGDAAGVLAVTGEFEKARDGVDYQDQVPNFV